MSPRISMNAKVLSVNNDFVGAACKGAPPSAAATTSVLTGHRYNEDEIPNRPPTKRLLRLAVAKAARAGLSSGTST